MAYNFTRAYADTQPQGEVMGTVTVSIPRLRGYRIDKKGRRRRFTDKFEIKLRQGSGGLNRRVLVSKLKADKDQFKDTIPSAKFTSKLMNLLKGKY